MGQEPLILPDSWRCDSCEQLMYLVEWREGLRYPIEGAPLPQWVGTRRFCLVCLFLHRDDEDIRMSYGSCPEPGMR